MAERYYVYTVVMAGRRLQDGLSGFGGGLQMVTCRELGAVVSQVLADGDGHGTPAATPENFWRHETVVEAVCASGAALPVRFGTMLPDADAVARALEERYETLLADVRRLGDKREVTVTAMRQSCEDEPQPGASGAMGSGPTDAKIAGEDHPGTEYLRQRQAAYRREAAAHSRASTLADEVRDALSPLAADCRLSVCPTERLAVRAVFLLQAQQVPRFEQAFGELRQRHAEAQFLMSGPWPPYSFVTAAARRDARAAHADERVGAV